MPPPIAVSLTNRRGTWRVGRSIIGDLRYSAAAPGGYKAASFSLRVPLAPPPPMLTQYTDVVITDGRTANVLWAGWIDSLGRTVDQGGATYDVGCVGPAAHTLDQAKPVVYADSRLSQFVRADLDSAPLTPSGTYSPGGDLGEVARLTMQFPRTTVLAVGSQVTGRYSLLASTGQNIGRASAVHVEGRNDANYRSQWVTRTVALAGAVAVDVAWSTTQAVMTAGPDLTRQVVDLRIARATSGFTVADDGTTGKFWQVCVRGTLVDAAGVEIAAGYANSYVLPHEVVTDLIGRYLPLASPYSVISQASTVQVDQLAYEGGVTANGVLADLVQMDPSMWWAMWEKDVSGRYVLQWQPWPSAPTLRATAKDGFRSPGAGGDLVNTVRVRWKDPNAVPRWSSYGQFNPTLSAAGRDRSSIVDQGSEAGSQATADAAGAAALKMNLWPTANGTLTISRPITDAASGRAVAPYEVPRRCVGKLVVIRDLESRRDALNVSDRDGASVYRITNAEYSAADAACTVTLDNQTDTVMSAFSRQARRNTRARRP